MIIRAARFLFLFSRSPIMDIFLRGPLCREGSCLSWKSSRFPFSLSHLSSRFFTFIVSRYNTLKSGHPCRVSQRDSIFTELVLSLMCGPFDLSSPSHPPARIFPVIVDRYPHNIDCARYHAFLHPLTHSNRVHPTSGRALFHAGQPSWSIVSYTRSATFRNPFRLFSVCWRFCKIFVRMYDGGTYTEYRIAYFCERNLWHKRNITSFMEQNLSAELRFISRKQNMRLQL